MSLERWVRLLSGIIIMVTMLLAILLDTNAFLILTALVGVSLLQSGFTNWCPLMMFLQLMGVRELVCPVIYYEQKLYDLKAD